MVGRRSENNNHHMLLSRKLLHQRALGGTVVQHYEREPVLETYYIGNIQYVCPLARTCVVRLLHWADWVHVKTLAGMYPSPTYRHNEVLATNESKLNEMVVCFCRQSVYQRGCFKGDQIKFSHGCLYSGSSPSDISFLSILLAG